MKKIQILVILAAFARSGPVHAEPEAAPASEETAAESGEPAGAAIGSGPALTQGGAGLQQGSADKPARGASGSAVGSSGGGGAVSGGGAPAHGAAAPAEAAPAGDDWLHTDLGPDTPARHRPTTVPCAFESKIDTNHETVGPFCSVISGETSDCYHASKVLVLWQQWHFRRMNRVADNSSGCANVPASEQAKIRAIQAKNQEAFDRMDKLSAQEGWDEHCDAIIQVYHDFLDWNTLSMFFKGRYMNRCAPATTVGEDWWPRPPCPNDPATGRPVPRELCSPPLP